MIIIFFIFYFFIRQENLQAGEGIILVLETPLFEKADVNSKILSHVRKGDKIYIYDGDMGNAPHEVDFAQYDPAILENKHYEISEQNDQGFFKTTDGKGKDAFILKGHIKPIYKDARESINAISPYTKDPTDYRLAEPLAPKYPIYEQDIFKAALLFSFGPPDNSPYVYPSTVVKEDYSSRKGFKFLYMKNMLSDETNRFFLGGLFSSNAASSERILENGNLSKEINKQAGLGPVMSYDFYRKENLTISAVGGILLVINETKVDQSRNGEVADLRKYQGRSLLPHIGNHLQIHNVIPKLDIVAAINLELNLPHSQKGSAAAEPSLWNNPNLENLSKSLQAQYSFQIGIQTNY